MERRGFSPSRTFLQAIEHLNPTLLNFEHIAKVANVVDRVLSGEIQNLLVFAPPRYQKSECFSRILPAHFLKESAGRKVGLASYSADLAWELSEEARDNYRELGGELQQDTTAKKRWKTTQGGEMWASGLKGPMLGRGYHLGIIDDPVDPDQAGSPTYQKRWASWFPGKFLSRQEPGAKIVGVFQRLGVEDPADFLFRREVGEGMPAEPIGWHVLCLDEIHSDEPLGRWNGPKGLPPTCTLEPDWRRVGEILAPTRFSREQVKRLQATAGSVITASQRQQRPMRPSGDFWKKAFFRTYRELPDHAYDRGVDWDTAYTKDEANSASAYVESFRGPGEQDHFPIYINDVDWDYLEFPELVKRMKSIPGPHYVEQKATGKSAVQTLAANAIVAEEVPVKGDKMARASAAQPAASNRRIWIKEEILNTLLFGERQGLLRITAERLVSEGAGLDLNDAFVQAVHRHLGIHRKKERRIQFA